MPDTVAVTQSSYPLFPEQMPEGGIVEGRYAVRFARTLDELDAVLKLRFEVFNLELGEGLATSYETGRDIDAFDAVCHHLIVIDQRTDEIVGTYRMQTWEMASRHSGFYSATIFDLDALPEEVLYNAFEVGRACVALAHRNTQVLFLLWRGMALYVNANRKRYLFGCSSLTSQDEREGRTVLAYLEDHGHLHPTLAVTPQPGYACGDETLTPDPDVRVKLPKLFRIYLRHGAKVCGPPAIDRQFKTIDFLMLFDVEAMSERQVRTFFG